MTYQEKNELCATKNVTLDGKPATISGAMLDLAVVRQFGSFYSCEYSWDTVKHIVDNKHGNFKS